MNKKSVLLILLFFFLLILSLNAFAGEPDGRFYWNFNDNTDDQWGAIRDTNNGVTYSTNYPIFNISGNGTPKSGDFELGDSDHINVSTFGNLFNGTNNFSVSGWYWIESFGAPDSIHSILTTNEDHHLWIGYQDTVATGKIFKSGYKIGGVYRYCYSNVITEMKWYHVVVTYNSVLGGKLYINTTLEDSNDTFGDILAGTERNDIGSYASDYYYDGLMDNFKIYNKTLNQTEINNLYNYGNTSGAGVSDSLDLGTPIPTNNSVFSHLHTTVDFNLSANCSDAVGFDCSLYINNTLNQTTTGYSQGNNKNVSFSETLTEGNWTYFFVCNDSTTTENTSLNLFEIKFGDTINLSQTLPANNTQINSSTVSFNLTINATNKIDCHLLINDTINQTNSYAGAFGIFASFSETFSNGNWSYFVSCNDSYTVENSSKYYFEVNENPDTINLSTPYPKNNTQWAISQIFFNLSVNASNNFDCHLLINSTINQTIAYSNGTNINVSFNYSLSDGLWNYWVSCNDSYTTENTSNNIFYIDTVNPFVQNTNMCNGTSCVFYMNNITKQWNITDAFILHSYNLSWTNGTRISYRNNLNVSSYSINISVNISGLAFSNYSFFLKFCDGHSDDIVSTFIFDNGKDDNYSKYIFEDDSYLETKSTTSTGTWTSKKEDNKYTQEFRPDIHSHTQVFIEKSDQSISIKNDPNGENTYLEQWIIIKNSIKDKWKDYVLKDEPNARVSIKRLTAFSVEVTISGITKHPELLRFSSIGDLNCVNETYDFYRKTVPKLDVNSPLINYTMSNSNFSINFTVNDTIGGSGYINMTIVIDGKANSTSNVLRNNTYAITSSISQEGLYVWSLNASNEVATNTSDNYYYIIDLTQPIITSDRTPASVSAGAIVDFNFSVTDTFSINQTATLSVRNPSGTTTYPAISFNVNQTNVTINTNMSGNYSAKYNPSEEGNHAYTFTVFDEAGNSQTSSGNVLIGSAGAGGGGGTGATTSLPLLINISKIDCDISFTPSNVNINDNNLIVEVSIINNEIFDYNANYNFIDLVGSFSDNLFIIDATEEKFFIEYNKGVLDDGGTGIAKLNISSNRCFNKHILVNVNVSKVDLKIFDWFIKEENAFENLWNLLTDNIFPENSGINKKLPLLKNWILLIFSFLFFTYFLRGRVTNSIKEEQNIPKMILWIFLIIIFSFASMFLLSHAIKFLIPIITGWIP